MTTNLPLDEWTEVFRPERFAGALLDRLTHHVHILEMNGASYRLRGSRREAAAGGDVAGPASRRLAPRKCQNRIGVSAGAHPARPGHGRQAPPR